MTTLKDTLKADLTVNLKARNELETTTLRSVLGAIQTQEKAGKTAVEFDDAQVEAVLAKELKKRRETAAEYTRVNVLDRAARETAEADFIATYLPEGLSEDEVRAIVTETVAGFEAPTMRDFGAIMKQVVAQVKGRADGKLVSELVKAQLS